MGEVPGPGEEEWGETTYFASEDLLDRVANGEFKKAPSKNEYADLAAESVNGAEEAGNEPPEAMSENDREVADTLKDVATDIKEALEAVATRSGNEESVTTEIQYRLQGLSQMAAQLSPDVQMMIEGMIMPLHDKLTKFQYEYYTNGEDFKKDCATVSEKSAAAADTIGVGIATDRAVMKDGYEVVTQPYIATYDVAKTAMMRDLKDRDEALTAMRDIQEMLSRIDGNDFTPEDQQTMREIQAYVQDGGDALEQHVEKSKKDVVARLDAYSKKSSGINAKIMAVVAKLKL